MLFTGLGRSVLGETVPEILSSALGPGPRAVLKTSGTVSRCLDTPVKHSHSFLIYYMNNDQYMNNVYVEECHFFRRPWI